MSKRSILVLVASLVTMFGATSAFAANSLDVNANAALVGNFGLEVLVDGSTNAVYVADTSPAAETVYRVEFRIGHNGIAMDDGTGHNILLGRQGAPSAQNVIRISMSRASGQYKINCRIKNDGPGTSYCGKFTFAPVTTRVGFEYVASTGGNGEFRLKKGDTVQFEKLDYDVSSVIDTTRWGAPKGSDVDATTNGSFYLDDFSSFRTLAP